MDDRGCAHDPRWRAIMARDPAADGLFWYSVATTGVYCRPSCPSRVANPVNVAIHASLGDARATGFRPCLRCRPEGAGVAAERVAMVERACRTIEQAERPPSLADLAAAAGVGAGWFHRSFRAVTGVTPRGYAVAVRAARLRDGLAAGASVTAAAQDAGFASGGHVQAHADAALGMTPTRYRGGGRAETLRHAVAPCGLGLVLVASSARGVAAILIGDDADALIADLRVRFPAAVLVAGDADQDARVAQVVAHIAAPAIGLDLPLDIRGTAFRQRVWAALRAIPAGQTASYADVATQIGAPQAVRAVAGACAANAHAVAIPCHRVVRSDGGLSGYRWGTARKRALLDRESADEKKGRSVEDQPVKF